MKKNTSQENHGCGCKSETKETDGVIKQRIAKRAAVLTSSLPDDLSCSKMPDQKTAKFLSNMRAFMAECTLANAWGTDEVSSYSRTIDLVESVFDLGTFAETAPAGCGDAKRTCVQRCDFDDGGYFCYFDCRLEYMACLIGSVLGNAKSRD